jgi:hypothetical protein
VKLPDGTVVFYTANPTDAAPKIDGVVLSAKEYQQLVEQAEQLKKLRETTKPVSPSACHVRGKVDAKGGKPVAKLVVEYSFRTTAPRTVVLLGGQRAAPVAATGTDGKIPLLESTADGLAVVVEQPGEQKVTLELEAAVLPRGGKNELGFEVGLPRAAITSLAFEPPGPAVKKLIVGTRTPEAAAPRPPELKRTTDDAARFAGKGVPLGPIDLLEVAWETPTPATPAATDTALSADADVTVRVDDAQIETTTKLRLKGPAREWLVQLPADAAVTAARANVSNIEAIFASSPAVTRVTDPKLPAWKIQTPDAGEWVVTAVVRQPRPDAKDAKHPGPYPVGIAFAVGVPKQTGTVRIFAPPTIRLSNYKHSAEVRRQDAAAGADAPVAAFRYATAAAKPPTLEFEARPARGFTAVQPHHRLDLTRDGWRLRTEVRVTPVRTVVEQLTFDLPSGWRDQVVVRPDDRVDEVAVGAEANGKRPLTIRLAAGQSEPFALTVETLFPLDDTASDAALPLPKFTGSEERESQLTVTVPDGFTVRGTAAEAAANATPVDLLPATPPKPGAAVPQLAGTFETPLARLDVAWQPYRAELAATARADVTVGERQLTIVETIQFKAADAIGRPIRLKGPVNPLAFQATPAVEPAGGGLWTLTPAADAKEVTLTVSYAVPLPPRVADKPVSADVPLVWPDATKVTATVRVWGAAAGRRPANVQGTWEERPPEPTPDRDALPWLTLAAAGGPKAVPLAFDLVESADAGAAVVERAVVQTWASADGAVQGRARFLLKRWPAGGIDVELTAAGPPTVFVNKDRADGLTPLPGGDESARAYRVPLPEARPSRPTLVVELQYALPPQPAGELLLVPPRVRGAVLQAPAWWQVAVPSRDVPLVFTTALLPDVRWGWRGGLPAPVAGLSPAELDRWFAGGVSPDGEAWVGAADDAVTGRQATPATVRVVRVPRLPFVVTCSLLTLIVGLAVSRLRPALVGPTVALWGVLAIAAAVLIPQPAAQMLSAGLPGLLALAVALAVGAAARWLARRRVRYLPTFRREVIVPAAPSGSGSNNRTSRNGAPSLDVAKSSAPVAPPQAAS